MNYVKIVRFFSWLVILLAFAAAFYFYDALPDQLVTHWGLNGEPNGYSSKGIGLFLLPGLMLAIYLLLFFVPLIDPLRKNIEEFRDYYEGFLLAFLLLFLYVFSLMILWNLGMPLPFNLFFPPAFGLFIYYLGLVIGHAKPNWFIGIRTPWTLTSPEVWQRTHTLAAKLFKACGVISFFSILFLRYSFALIMGPLVAVAVWSFVYSYIKFRQLKT